MDHTAILDLEADIDRTLGGPARRWTREGYAQGVLLDLLEVMGYAHEFLPPMQLPSGETIIGSRFFASEGRSFTAVHPQPGVALVMAAVMALHATSRHRTVAVA